MTTDFNKKERIRDTTKHYQHIRRGQSRNDLELNQKPVLINQPYCKKIKQ
jgi:hypothetical protein